MRAEPRQPHASLPGVASDGRKAAREPESRALTIRWAARLPPRLLKQLYDSDARGFRDLELCDAVGSHLYARCETFHRVQRRELACPSCGRVFGVAARGRSECPGAACAWSTTRAAYEQSIRNHYAHPGRAGAAFAAFYQRYPSARGYRDKILLIDQLVHGFHVDEKTSASAKSVASKLLEGNKKEVVRFLDELSALDPARKDEWRRNVAATIDARVLRTRVGD